MKILRVDEFDVSAEGDASLKGLIGEYLFEKYVRWGRLPFQGLNCIKLENVCYDLATILYLKPLQQILGDNLLKLLITEESKALHEAENLINNAKSMICMDIHVEHVNDQLPGRCIFCSERTYYTYINIPVYFPTYASPSFHYIEYARKILSIPAIPSIIRIFVCPSCLKSF